MTEPLTVIFFSCRRLDLLYRTVDSFLKANTYPFNELIIVNDSGDPSIHEQIRNTYEGATFVFHPENIGLMKSIDLGYAQIKTEYFFHDEDDWMFRGAGGFIEQSMEIMKSRPDIEEVWLKPFNNHPIDPEILQAGSVKYRMVAENFQKGRNGYNDFAWHGFTTACGLKRISDYRKVGPYSEIPWEGTIWHREQAIGERYHQLGYRSACLIDDIYIENIGYGRSEYKHGFEK